MGSPVKKVKLTTRPLLEQKKKNGKKIGKGGKRNAAAELHQNVKRV